MGADQRLVSYIREQLKAGYDINTIRTHLINYGYSPEVVYASIEASKPKKIPVIPIAAGAVVIIAIVGIILFFSLREEVPSKLLDLDTSMISIEESVLDFNVEMVNMGAAKRYDVSLNHEIIDSAGNILISEQESIGMETRTSKRSEIMIPETIEPGSYTLKTTAVYDGQEATASFMFIVKANGKIPVEEEIEEEIPECPASCDDLDNCTRDYCGTETGYVCVHDSIPLCCGNKVCEDGESYENCPSDCIPEAEEVIVEVDSLMEVVEQIEVLAAEDLAKAVGFCEGLREDLRDGCYKTLAEITNNSVYCNEIVSNVDADICYTKFAMAGEFALCEKIVNQYLHITCENYAEAYAE